MSTGKKSLCILFIMGVSLMKAPLTAQKIETRDGIRLIHNEKGGKWGKTAQIKLELIRKIGDIDTDDLNLAFHMPSDISLDTAGNLYVMDTGNHRVQVFSPEREYLKTIGRKGQGPGEFNYPDSLDIDPEGRLIVMSSLTQLIKILDDNGKELESIKTENRHYGSLRQLDQNSFIIEANPPSPFNSEGKVQTLKPTALLQILDYEGKPLKELGMPRDYKHNLVNMTANRISYALDKDFIYVVFQYQNRIEKYTRQGDLIWRADRDLNYKADEPLDKGKLEIDGGNRSISGAQMNRCAESLTADEKGRIWVITLNRQLKKEERAYISSSTTRTNTGTTVTMSARSIEDIRETDAYRLDVFDPDGVLLGSLPLDHFADSILVSKDRLLVLDRLRGMQIFEYQIVD